MITDYVSLDTPQGKEELAALEALKVGDMREGPLFPALPVGVVWICTGRGDHYWELDGRFCGEPLGIVVIRKVDGKELTLLLKVTK